MSQKLLKHLHLQIRGNSCCISLCYAPHFLFISQVVIFFSAHGVPQTYIEDAGDPYKDEMEACVELMMKELRNQGIHNRHTLAYQVLDILNCQSTNSLFLGNGCLD